MRQLSITRIRGVLLLSFSSLPAALLLECESPCAMYPRNELTLMRQSSLRGACVTSACDSTPLMSDRYRWRSTKDHEWHILKNESGTQVTFACLCTCVLAGVRSITARVAYRRPYKKGRKSKQVIPLILSESLITTIYFIAHICRIDFRGMCNTPSRNVFWK